MKDIEKKAKKLHEEWLEKNREYVELCRKKPMIYNQSHDFDRSVDWGKLPEHWKKEYMRIVRYMILTDSKH